MRELIATVEAKFDKHGKIKSTFLKPALKNILASEELLEFTRSLPAKTMPPIQVRTIGERLLAQYFSHITNMELADTDKYYIDSEMVACEKYRNGVTKKCVINFLFKAR
jgi:hypothetical protein